MCLQDPAARLQNFKQKAVAPGPPRPARSSSSAASIVAASLASSGSTRKLPAPGRPAARVTADLGQLRSATLRRASLLCYGKSCIYQGLEPQAAFLSICVCFIADIVWLQAAA